MASAAGWTEPNAKSLDCGFQYEPLQHEKSFRLLKLFPSSDLSSAIECTLSEQSMESSKGQYCALSYAWGDTQNKQEIILNGRPAFVTNNLHAALSQLQHMSGLLGNMLKPLFLWIDAICINQQDNREEMHQVGCMKDIFANAQVVVAWLGLEADDSGTIMHALNQRPQDLDFSTITRSALTSFLSRPWWLRVWIVQEFMVCNMTWFICGEYYANSVYLFGFLSDTLRFLNSQSYYITDVDFRDLLSWRLWFLLLTERWQKQKTLPLLELMELTQFAGATDPRDRVFALLGLVGPGQSLQIKPDYTLSPCEVFCGSTRAMANAPERSKEVLEEISKWPSATWRPVKHEGHWPLKENVPERANCDGVACASRELCIELPGRAKPDAARVVQYFIAGLQDPKPRAM